MLIKFSGVAGIYLMDNRLDMGSDPEPRLDPGNLFK